MSERTAQEAVRDAMGLGGFGVAATPDVNRRALQHAQRTLDLLEEFGYEVRHIGQADPAVLLERLAEQELARVHHFLADHDPHHLSSCPPCNAWGEAALIALQARFSWARQQTHEEELAEVAEDQVRMLQEGVPNIHARLSATEARGEIGVEPPDRQVWGLGPDPK